MSQHNPAAWQKAKNMNGHDVKLSKQQTGKDSETDKNFVKHAIPFIK